MDTIETLRDMSPGVGRARAAHQVVTDATDKAATHRDDIDTAAAVLLHRFGWTKARLARAAHISVTNLFPPRVVVPEPSERVVLADEAAAETWLNELAVGYREEQDRAKAAREIRRDDIVALYQGHLDRRQWERTEIARETGMSDSLVKGDLAARKVELRFGRGERVATLDGPPARLPDIARMLRVAPNRLRDTVQAHKRAGTFPEDAMVEGKYVPRVVAEWWPTTARAAYAPQGEQLATLARRQGESYVKVKAAVWYAEEDGTFPAGVKLDDGTFDAEKWLAWWQAREEALTAGTTLKALAEEVLHVDYGWLRERVKAYRAKHGALPDGVRLPYRRWDGEKFLSEVWPIINNRG